MDFDLKEFSLTIAVGLCVVGVLWLALRSALEKRAKALAMLTIQNSDARVIPLLFASVVILAVGMIAEDLSKNALAERPPAAFAPQFQRLMPSEKFDRSKSLAGSRSEWKRNRETTYASVEACRHPMSKDKDARTKIWFRYTRLGADIRGMLETGAATLAVDESSAYRSLLAAEAVWDRKADPDFDFNGLKDWTKFSFISTCKQYLDGLSPLYYVAKNRAFREPHYFEELESLSTRYEFARSLCYVLMAGIYVVIFFYLMQNTVTMWRDIGGGKSVVSVLLGLVLLAAIWDVMAFWPASNACSQMVAGSDAPSCVDKINLVRGSLLPAIFLFVCLYRMRRIWRRVLRTFWLSIESTVPASPILAHQRERDAWNALVAVVALWIACTPVRLAYESDHEAYLKRVFAYYLVQDDKT